ncbi:MAG: hypothetical protein ACI4TK_17750 [Agathobacter sp.]
MNIDQVLEVLKKRNISHYLTEMSQVHMYTKHYLLVAEELSEEGVTFLQPLKEHRDAYDHLSRIFALSLKDDDTSRNEEVYILDNVKKAFGHEYRAFFDMADWFTYIFRKYVREELSNKIKRKKYQEKYDFEDTKKFINQLPFSIAKFREDKDVSKEQPILDEVLEYIKVMDRLLEIYKQVQDLTV